MTSQRSGLPKRRRHLPEVNEVIEVTGNRSASRGPPTSPANLRPRDRDVLRGGGAVRGAVEEAAGETHGGHPARRKLARNRGGDPARGQSAGSRRPSCGWEAASPCSTASRRHRGGRRPRGSVLRLEAVGGHGCHLRARGSPGHAVAPEREFGKRIGLGALHYQCPLHEYLPVGTESVPAKHPRFLSAYS